MAKTVKQSARDQYRAILVAHGIHIEDCDIRAFRFESESRAEMFHYELMHPLRPIYHLFDHVGNVATVLMPKDRENTRMLESLAESCGGEKTTPNLR